MRELLPLIGLWLLAFSSSWAQFCTNDTRFAANDFFTNSQIEVQTNLVYGQAINAQGNWDTLLMDVYRPRSSADPLLARPAVLMMHGGAFLTGNKSQRVGECLAFARRGYVAISINYRLGWNANFPNSQLLAMYRAQQDANAALRYLVDQAATFRIDTSWLFIGGTSAGALTANHVVYADSADWEAIFPNITNQLGGLQTSSNNLTHPFQLKGIFNNWGGALVGTPDGDALLPQVAFHGAQDTIVDIDTLQSGGLVGSRGLHQYLVANGTCSELTVDTLGEHGIYTNLRGSIFRAARASCFFKSIFCRACVTNYLLDSVPPTCAIITSTTEASPSQPWQVYPNPLQQTLHIEGLLGEEQLYLYHVLGGLIWQRAATPTLEVGTLPQGLYVLHIRRGGQTQQIRLIKP